MEIIIQTTVLVIFILAVRRVFGEKLHVYIRYGLWLLVVLRLLIPVNFISSPLSILHIGSALAEQYSRITGISGTSDSGSETDSLIMAISGDQAAGRNYDMAAGEAESDAGIYADPADSSQGIQTSEQTKDSDSISSEEQKASQTVERAVSVVRIIWITGGLLVGGFLASAHIRFRRRLYRMRKPYRNSKAVKEIMYASGRTAGIPVYRIDKLESPCLVGVMHPAVYIGSDMKAGSDYFRYTVTHEKVHYLHGDHIWAVIRAALVTVYWFHPFVWIAAAASARDGEIACDYGTVRQLGEKERIAYGTMLLELSRINGRKRMYSYGTMLRPGRSEMKERILRLAGGNDSRMSVSIMAILLMFIMAGCAFTGVSQYNNEDRADNAVEEEAVSRENSPQNENPSGDGNAVLSGSEETEDSGENAGNEAAFNPDDTVSEQRQLSAVSAALSEDTVFGADGPWLDYAGRLGMSKKSVIVFHDYFGLVIFDLTSGEVLQSLDLACIDCHMTQGDNVCEVRVSNDGTIVWLHPRSRQYMFRYEVESNQLYQLPIVKSFEADLEAEDLFDHYTVAEEEYAGWHSNYLYEEYKDEKGFHTTYINLYVPDKAEQRLGSLQCIWDDMVYVLCQDGIWPGDIEAEAEFPYRYDGVVEQVMILYDEPCVYSRISDDYGSRVHPQTGDIMKHEGIDYAAEAGTDITAAADGVVYKQGYSEEYGIFVVLLHVNGDMTYYCHCQEITVAEGEQVRRGDKIATVGNTGRSTGAHLHFALSQNGEFVDPAESMRSGREEQP